MILPTRSQLSRELSLTQTDLAKNARCHGDPTVRDRHIAQIRSNGRMAWQVATGYNQRSRIETQIGRWKSVIGPKLKSRSFSRQITEIQVGQKVLNTMTALGRPVFERIARRYRLGTGEFHLRPDPCNNAEEQQGPK